MPSSSPACPGPGPPCVSPGPALLAPGPETCCPRSHDPVLNPQPLRHRQLGEGLRGHLIPHGGPAAGSGLRPRSAGPDRPLLLSPGREACRVAPSVACSLRSPRPAWYVSYVVTATWGRGCPGTTLPFCFSGCGEDSRRQRWDGDSQIAWCHGGATGQSHVSHGFSRRPGHTRSSVWK